MKMFDLFAGIGGISLAAHWAGIETVGFCEIEPFCQKVLQKHWPDVPIWSDIKELTGDEIKEICGAVDIIAGGFPCQPYSVAGKRKGSADNRALWPEMLRVIRETRPRWVVGENVAGFINLGLDKAISDLESEGYTCQSFLIPACVVGALHQRFRVFIVGYSLSFGLPGELRRRTGAVSKNGYSEMEKGVVAYTSCNLRNRSILAARPAGKRKPSDSGSHVANACLTGLERTKLCRDDVQKDETGKEGSAGATTKCRWDEWGYRAAKSRMGGMVDGLSQWLYEPDIPRVAKGIKWRVDRLRALGNAVVPQQVYPIFKAIMELTHNGYQDCNTSGSM